MTTVVNNPSPVQTQATETGGNSSLVTAVVLIGFVFLFIYFGLPAIRQFKIPASQVIIPDKINVNVQQTK